jgi:2-amino-4-hydroxy-6-hydroxymethyldihydropteridine diphosphokinase
LEPDADIRSLEATESGLREDPAASARLVAIGLGSSLGDRRRMLDRTVALLSRTPGFTLVSVSRWYRSAPMPGGTATGWFLNGVAVFRCERSPHEILDVCRALEARAGRRRARHWADRTLDLDVLHVEGVRSADADLTLPHPGVAERAFVWWPLLEAWPEVASSLGGTSTPARHSIVAVSSCRTSGALRGPSRPSRTTSL